MTTISKENKSYIKDAIYIIVFLLTIGGMFLSFSNRFALVEHSVKQNTETLKTNDLNLINYRLNQIDKKVDQILIKLDK